MSDCVDDTPDYVENQAIFSRSIFEFQPIPNLENITVKIKHFPNFQGFVRTLPTVSGLWKLKCVQSDVHFMYF